MYIPCNFDEFTTIIGSNEPLNNVITFVYAQPRETININAFHLPISELKSSLQSLNRIVHH